METAINYQERTHRSMIKFFEYRGKDIIEESPEYESFDAIIDDNDVLVFVKLKWSQGAEGGFEPDQFDRQQAEIDAAKWLAEHGELCDKRIRFDAVALIVLSETKAFLRWHTNIGSQGD